MEIADRLARALAGRYEIERELGRGGMAVVFLARDVKHDRRVAVKVLRPELAVTLAADRFLREIQIAAQLQHPLIVPLYHSGAVEELLWYAMPYVEGETLRQRLVREGQLPLEDALRITRDAAEALSHAHQHGFIHRDIKPENILLSGGHAVVADFGIARAITQASGQGTSSGVAIGTPAYMSPEQGSGGAKLDARSDIYSLGCVLYEMLAGEPPFTGQMPQAVIAKHVSQPAPSVRVVRPTTPVEVEGILERALAKVPADRFASAEALIDALTAAPAAPSWRTPTMVRATVALAVAGVVAALAVYLVMPRVFFGEALNPSQYVLAPFLAPGRGPNAERYQLWQQELMSALRQVPDISLVESTLVNDRRMRRPGDASDFGYWLQVATDLHAGRLVVPSLVTAGDSSQMVAEVFDVRGGRALRRAQVSKGESVGATDVAARLVEQLFALPNGALRISRSVVEGAQRAFVAGKAALETWNLRLAEKRFEEAAALDPGYVAAHFWLAQTKAWAGDSVDQWIGAARRAAVGMTQLANGRERALAAALVNVAERQFPQACARYDSLVAADSLDFEAWFGLGECHARDDIVVPDPRSPSGWRWRTSYRRAIAAYERALQVVPSFVFAFSPWERLAQTLIVDPPRRRPGRPLPPDTGVYWSFASWENDTLAFIPWPAAIFATRRPPATLYSAIDRNREQLLRIVRNWARAFPDSSRPYHALGRGLEVSGALDGGGSVERSALAAAARALETARTGPDSLAAALLEVRLLVKLFRFAEAREVASQALARWRSPEPEEAAGLAALAALTGRAHLTAQWSTVAAHRLRSLPEFTDVPLPILETAEGGLVGYAALGAPAESIAAFASRLDALLQVNTRPAQATYLRCWRLRMAVGDAFPVLRRPVGPAHCRNGIPMLEMQWALVHGDSAGVRTAYQRGRALRQDILPGDIAIDHVYHEAWALTQVGDSAEAGRYLGRSLAALPGLRAGVIRDEPTEAAGLVRAMALRAELAARAGDRSTARQWAEPVTILWLDADPELRPVVDRMRALAAGKQGRR